MTRNQKVLLGLGLGAVAIYFISKNMKANKMAEMYNSSNTKCPAGTTFVQLQCITAPCLGECIDIPDA